MDQFVQQEHWDARVSRALRWGDVELIELELTRKQWMLFDEAVELTGENEAYVYNEGMAWCRGKHVDLSTHFGPWLGVFVQRKISFESEIARVKREHEERVRLSPDACAKERRLQLELVIAEYELLRRRFVHKRIGIEDLKLAA